MLRRKRTLPNWQIMLTIKGALSLRTVLNVIVHETVAKDLEFLPFVFEENEITEILTAFMDTVAQDRLPHPIDMVGLEYPITLDELVVRIMGSQIEEKFS